MVGYVQPDRKLQRHCELVLDDEAKGTKIKQVGFDRNLREFSYMKKKGSR